MRPILSQDRLIHLLMIVCRSSVASRTSIIGGICPQAPSRRHFTQIAVKIAINFFKQRIILNITFL